MLGARARAAEYEAFKAATARQATHEAEEQHLPPKSAPFSLSAFTKAPVPNRNKGNKTWVPLILEDVPSSDQLAPDGDEVDHPILLSTPTPRRSVRVPINHTDPRAEVLYPSRPTLQPVHINMPAYAGPAPPVAPKAMAAPQFHPPPLLNPTPRRIESHSIIQGPHYGMAPSLHSTPRHPASHSWYPIPDPRSLNGFHDFETTNQFPVPSPDPNRSYGVLMAPDDISPAKQENKLAFLSEMLIEQASGSASAQQPHTKMPNIGSDLLPPAYISGVHSTTPLVWDPPQETVDYVQAGLSRPRLQHLASAPMTTGVRDHYNNAAMTENVSFTGGGNIHFNPPQATYPPVDLSTCTVEPLYPTEREPYDRKSKMESFVAAQQALAKTGKTVLHNPDLYRAKPGDDTAATGDITTEQPPAPAFEGKILVNKSAALLKPPPGLEFPTTGTPIIPTEGPADTLSPLKQEELWEMFGVGSPDWLELRPVTKTERAKMNKAMRLCATVESIDSPRALAPTSLNARLQDLHRATQTDPRGNEAARRAVDQLADEHFADRVAQLTLSGRNLSSKGLAKPEVERASIDAVGNILINVTGSNDNHGDDDHVGNFCKYKPAPEYAIERGRLLSGNGGTASYFEEETGGFYSAPSRIARDPRFRPPSKEASKGKPDDEWKHRHDLYGRRRL